MNPTTVVVSRSEDATERLGRTIAQSLRPGMVVALYGDLGAGKTVLSRGIARGLGIRDKVTSPTFTVVQEYCRPDGTYLFHLDMYRIENEDAALAFGVEEYLFAADGVSLVEWPERIEGLLLDPGTGAPAAVWTLRLYHGEEGSRHIELPDALFEQSRAMAHDDPELMLHL